MVTSTCARMTADEFIAWGQERGTRARDAGADETGVITTHVVRDGTVRLEPPGMVLGRLFPAERPAP